MTALPFLAIGLAAGILSGLFGVGGGIIIVPALLLVRHMSPQLAVGTSLGALLAPVGLLAALQYARAGQLDAHAAAWIAGGLFVGAWAGAVVAGRLGAVTLQRAFALFLVLVAARLWAAAGAR